MKRTLIHNATIVNEGQSVQGSVVIENGRIAEVLTNWKPLSAPCEEVIDATGCYLLPGIIDDHVSCKKNSGKTRTMIIKSPESIQRSAYFSSSLFFLKRFIINRT